MLEVFKTAKALIEKGWTKGCLARDKNDVQVDTVSPEACKFCLLGALFRASNQDWATYNKAMCSIYRIMPTGLLVPGGTMTDFNDQRTKEDVLYLLDTVIYGYEVLIDARAIIEKGWCQGSAAILSDGTVDKHCLITALQAASHSRHFKPMKGFDLGETFKQTCGIDNIVLFNDKISTTKEMVLEAFDYVIGEVCSTQADSSTP